MRWADTSRPEMLRVINRESRPQRLRMYKVLYIKSPWCCNCPWWFHNEGATATPQYAVFTFLMCPVVLTLYQLNSITSKACQRTIVARVWPGNTRVPHHPHLRIPQPIPLLDLRREPILDHPEHLDCSSHYPLLPPPPKPSHHETGTF